MLAWCTASQGRQGCLPCCSTGTRLALPCPPPMLRCSSQALAWTCAVQASAAPDTLRAQVWRHESVKTWQVLVSLTACMVSSILARPDELNMKSPVGVNGMRAWFFLGERYRLPVLLRLHAISLVEWPASRGQYPMSVELLKLRAAAPARHLAGGVACLALILLRGPCPVLPRQALRFTAALPALPF